MAAIEYNDTPITIVDQEGQPWFLGTDLAKAIGYDENRSLTRLHARNAEEFQDVDTRVVKLTPQGASQGREYRIYSKTGAYLIAIMAKTEKAAKFRRWLVEVLNGDVALPGYEEAAKNKAILDGLRASLLEDWPHLVEHLELARSGLPLAKIAEIMEIDEYDVGAAELVLHQYGFDTPDLLSYGERIRSKRKSIVEGRIAKAKQRFMKTKTGSRNTYLLDDFLEKGKDAEGNDWDPFKDD